jgi:MYXO-CTERM domain-containing protein
MDSASQLRFWGAAVRRYFPLIGLGAAASVLSLIAAFTLASPAHAAFLVQDGNNPQPGDKNVLFQADDVGMSVEGHLNSTNEPVQFTSQTQFLAGNGGQARVEARTANDYNSPQVDINDGIVVNLLPNTLRFTSLIFNAFDGTGSLTIKIVGFNADNTPANATITLDDDGDPLNLGNGSNFYTVLATAGMTMASVEIETNAATSYQDLRQVRIGGAMPEPGSALLGGLALAAIWGLRRRTGVARAV